ncbi:MAG: hypothetical protein ACRC1M_07120 [Methanobacteriaceae archaeon]
MKKSNKIQIFILVIIAIGVLGCIKYIEDPYNLGLSKSLDKDYSLTISIFATSDENKDGKIDFNEYKKEFENIDGLVNGFAGNGTFKTDIDMIRKVFDLEDLNNDSIISPLERYTSFKST